MSDAYISFLLHQTFSTSSNKAPGRVALLSPIASYVIDPSQMQLVGWLAVVKAAWLSYWIAPVVCWCHRWQSVKTGHYLIVMHRADRGALQSLTIHFVRLWGPWLNKRVRLLIGKALVWTLRNNDTSELAVQLPAQIYGENSFVSESGWTVIRDVCLGMPCRNSCDLFALTANRFFWAVDVAKLVHVRGLWKW